MTWCVGDGLFRCLVWTSSWPSISQCMRPLSSSVAPLHFQIYIIGIGATLILNNRHKEVLAVLAFAFIVHTFPSLEHSSPSLLQDSLNHWSTSTPILAPTPHKNDRSSVIYFNAREIFPCSPFAGWYRCR